MANSHHTWRSPWGHSCIVFGGWWWSNNLDHNTENLQQEGNFMKSTWDTTTTNTTTSHVINSRKTHLMLSKFLHSEHPKSCSLSSILSSFSCWWLLRAANWTSSLEGSEALFRTSDTLSFPSPRWLPGSFLCKCKECVNGTFWFTTLPLVGWPNHLHKKVKK